RPEVSAADLWRLGERLDVLQLRTEDRLALRHDDLLHLPAFAEQLERQDADLELLVHDRRAVGMRDEPLEGRDERGADRRMPRERDLAAGGEDAVAVVGRRVRRRKDERRLGEVHLPRDGRAIRDRRVADRVQKFPESVVREMTRIAALHGAVNLAQGYPDFEPPPEVTEAAKRALDGGYNQYSITWGARELRDAIARRAKAFNGIDADPESNLVVTC